LNSSNKRACNFVNVTVVSSSLCNNNGKLKENVKRDTRKLLKHLKKNLKMKEKQHTQTRTHSCYKLKKTTNDLKRKRTFVITSYFVKYKNKKTIILARGDWGSAVSSHSRSGGARPTNDFW